jgi:HlyD family secretion protein
MKNRGLWVIGGVAILGGLIFVFTRDTSGGAEILYRYEAAREGELLLSTTSVGTMVPLTQVDVKSKAGGRVDRLLVEEGVVVKTGDVIATIDPTDTKSLYEQADAELDSAKARVELASTNADLEKLNSATRVQEAEVAVRLAEVRLERALTESKTQPNLTQAELARSEAEVAAQKEALRQFETVEALQMKRDAQSAVNRARTDVQTTENELSRQKSLLERGYVSRASVERAESAYEAAKASFDIAKQRLETIDSDISSTKRTLSARISQSESAAKVAQANRSRDIQAERGVQEARKALEQAKISLKQARDSVLQVKARGIDIQSARASVVRSQVQAANALDNLNQTTVKAPRPGVITRKYLEEGTIIPGAVSAFAEGTSIVQISDVTTMFVECRVDESDIASVRVGQDARIIVEAYPGTFLTGKVQRIFPAAETEGGAVTSIRVRVKIDPKGLTLPNKPIKPGMNATVEFIQLLKPKVLIVPAQAVEKDGEKSFVRVKGVDEKTPVRKEVKVGDFGNEGVEILEGLKPGEEVVVAEIDLAAARERQEKMLSAQGGGLGTSAPRGPSQSRRAGPAGGGGGGGGGR